MSDGSRANPTRDRLLRRGLKLTHLRLLATLAETGKISASAAHLAMSQPAASRLLAELDTIVGAKLYQRHSRGIVLTAFGERLAAWGKKMLRDLDIADREIVEMSAGDRGLVTIGSVTGPALELVLPVLRQIRVTHPGISTDIIVDTSYRLAEMLLMERMDFFIGRIPQDVDPRAFAANLIGAEPVSLIVRENHPLIRSGSNALAETVIYDWVLQAPHGLLRHTVETYLLERGLDLPNRVISTSSMLMTLALISQSNAIAPISRAVAQFFGGSEGIGGRIAILPMASDLAVSPYSVLRSSDRPLSPASQIVHDIIRERAKASVGSGEG